MLNAVGDGQQLVLDARLVALAVAAIALWRRVPFLGVVVLGAAGTVVPLAEGRMAFEERREPVFRGE